MAYNKFPAHAIIEINGAPYRPGNYTGGRLLLTHQITGATFLCEQPDKSMQLPTHDQFEALLASGDIVIKGPRSMKEARNLNDSGEWTRDQVIRISPKLMRKVLACQICDEHGVPRGEKAISAALDKRWTQEIVQQFGPKPSARSVRDWMTKFGTPGNRHPRHMMPKAPSVGDEEGMSELGNRVLWTRVLDGRIAGDKVATIHADYTREISQINSGAHPHWEQPAVPLKTYNKRTVRRRFDAVESDHTLANAIANEALEQDWRGAGKPMAADLVMQYVIVDHTQIDVHVVCPALEMVLGRPWLTMAIDAKSRAIVGHLITFNDPSSWSVSEILRRIVLPKRPPRKMLARYPILAKLRGKPGCLIFDNAVEFRAHSTEAAARDAGFSVRFCPVKKPRYRAICERAIGTLNRQTCELLPGRTLTLNDARRFGYDAEKQAVIMLDELEAVVNQIVASYNVEPHDGLGGRQPALVFQQDINKFGINNFADYESFARDVMEVRQGVQLSPSGIRAFKMRYNDIKAVPELLRDLVPMEPRRQRRDDATATVEFRYDSMDISRIHVWNRKTKKYVELRCADERYANGMPLWLHNKIRQAAKDDGRAFNNEQERLIARGHLIQAIRNIDASELAASRKRLADLIEIPRVKHATGNIVDVVNVSPLPAELGDFISHDRAALTALDNEILSPRSSPEPKSTKTALQRRREQAAEAQRAMDAPARGRRLLADRGGYQ